MDDTNFYSSPLQKPNLIERFGKGSIKIMLAVALLVVVAVVLFFFFGRSSFNDSNVTLNVGGQTEISAGDLITFKVSYFNKNRESLLAAKLTFSYPDGAIPIKDGNIPASNQETVDLGTINGKSGGDKEFQAYVIGDKGNLKIARATLEFNLKNIQSAFKKDAQLSTTITTLAIPLTLVAPPTANSGQQITYILDYRNQSTEDKNNLRVKLTYPNDFKPGQFVPPTSSGNDTWDIALLKQGDGARISISGILTGREREAKNITATLQRKITTPGGDVFVDYEKTDASTVISSPPLGLEIRLNDSQNYTAHLADRLRYILYVGNNNDFDILGLNLSARLDGNMFDLTTVSAKGFFDSRSRTIIWNPSVIPELGDLKPHQTIQVPFEVILKNNFSGGFGTKDSFVKVTAHSETTNVPAELALDKLAADDDLITRISSAPTFEQKTYKNDEVFGSEGPFPPKVDKKTVFFIHWTLVNPANDITPAKITAVLAPGVAWENKVRTNLTDPASIVAKAGPAYSQRANLVTWDIGTLPNAVGTTFPKYEGIFAVSITPSVNQVNKTLPLLMGSSFQGADNFTKEKLVLTTLDASTATIADVQSFGPVQP